MRKPVLLLFLVGCSSGDVAPAQPDAPSRPDAAPTPDAAPVTLHVTKDGDGSIQSTPPGISCGAGCASADASFPAGTHVTLQVTPAAGNLLAAWSGACAGIVRSCDVTLDSDAGAGARFAAIPGNLVFTPADTVDGDLGGLDGADRKCADAAAEAGLAGHYVALLSTDTVDARARLVVPGTETPARGFFRLDGLPIADTVADLFDDLVVLYPILFDQDGRPLDSSDFAADGDAFVWTGSFEDGTKRAGLTCDGYTSDDGAKRSVAGQPNGGPGAWLRAVGGDCSSLGTYGRNLHVYCFGVDSSAPPAFPKSPHGKRIYMTKSNFAMNGRAGADALCDAEKPDGAATVKALLTTTDAPAADLLDRETIYLRVDGTIIGSGADLVAVSRGHGTLSTGLWERGDGTYVAVDSSSGYRYLGVPGIGAGLDVVGTPASTCDDWTARGGTATGSFGSAQLTNVYALSGSPSYDCLADYLPIYCVEE